MSIDVKNSNWLAAIGAMPESETYIHLSNLNGLKITEARAAIVAMYGPNYATLHDHGTVFWGTHLHNVRLKHAAKSNSERPV